MPKKVSNERPTVVKTSAASSATLSGSSSASGVVDAGRPYRFATRFGNWLLRGTSASTFEHAGDGLSGSGLRPDGGEGVSGGVAFVGAVEDLPVAKLAASAKADGAGAHAAEREGDGGELASGEDAWESDIRGCGWGLRSGGRGRRLRGGKGDLLQEGTAPGHQPIG